MKIHLTKQLLRTTIILMYAKIILCDEKIMSTLFLNFGSDSDQGFKNPCSDPVLIPNHVKTHIFNLILTF